MTRTNIGIVGLGVISRFYVEAFRHLPSLNLAAVCDLRPEALAPFEGKVECYRSHQEMLQHSVLDAVVVNVPNDVHVTVCRDIIEAGLAVCVEKPLAISLAEGRELAALAERRGVPLFTSFHRRYNSNVLALLDSLPSDQPVKSLTVRYLEQIEEHAGADRWYLDPARCGGGCVADNGPNAFDLVRLFLGDVTLEDARVERGPDGVDRKARVLLRATGDAAVEVELDWSYPGEVKDISVELADGTRLCADMLTGYPDFKQSLEHEYVGVLEHFNRILTTTSDSSADGLVALELVDAVYRREVGGAR
ncbi:Gfo/Idh/MocA family oxidoreductase [Umezawaea sp. Da 62-37]|uniref:Gfo/Idh/MocA family protein n=1 Tax=Umezawaea sp. Da 62-37 TaxID=3075927 RepID=UPI0028F71E6F|nr:Gfo/Idh/MocA family oxidoreductase [Umezawaea sp. Da 62-37]WNV88984.1 Gfo/Idh/MocA family oxidoreductase [Umezawaea sp. Da 62-37]